MTTLDPSSLSASAAEAAGDYLPGDPFNTALISRLANELYGQGSRGVSAPVFPGAPTAATIPGIPAHSVLPGADFGVPHLGPSVSQAAPGVPGFSLPGVSESRFTGLPYVPDVSALPDFGSINASHHSVSPNLPSVHPILDPLAPDTRAPAAPDLSSLSGATPSRVSSLADHASPAASSAPGWRRIQVVDSPAGADPFAGPDFYFLTPGTSRSVPGHQAPHRAAFTKPGGNALPTFDVEAVRKDFPALHQKVHGKPLVWLDNAATTHKPQSVIDITSEFYSRHNSNIHRAAHSLAERATDLFEGGREKVRRFIGAASSKEIVFVRGTTEAINLVAQTFGRANIGPGDEVIVSTIEHHANIVPWQLLSQQTGAVLKVAPVNDRGELILEQFAALLNGRTKLVSITHVANALGTINPIEEIIALSHAQGVPVLVDAAQSSPHIPINVQALGADFLVLSGHKVFGPTGIGILYGKAALLESLPPWQGGGHMIKDVTFAQTVFQGIPEKFEAGTPDIAGAVGLGAAVDYLEQVGLPAIAAYEHDLLVYATDAISTVRGLRLIGTARNKASVLSFVIEGRDTESVAKFLDKQGIATRSGHHCAQPALRRFGVETTVRASLAFYNNREDVDALIRALHSLPRA